MDTGRLKRFAQFARRNLIEQVSAKMTIVLDKSSMARREKAEAVRILEEKIANEGYHNVVKQVAYTWFNRFCALRFMDVNRYTHTGVLSPAHGQFQPEILSEAKMGHIDEEIFEERLRERVFSLLEGRSPSPDPQGEAYRLLVAGTCNYWNRTMSFLFERIEDYTEMLMPDDLLSGSSILAYTREAMTPDVCEDVEVIGWLYQFYISEEKDEVFAGLKKNQKITPEKIPAATQLFTPRWIVRYLVENSLGRLWMLNRPDSRLANHMDYYIRDSGRSSGTEKGEPPAVPRIASPEEIKICDPACGSGHMLVCTFDLLYLIYEEEGYDPAEIPGKILTHNLYGIEIDRRAGELAAFALVMKARRKQRRFLPNQAQPNICVLENVRFEESELEKYMDFLGNAPFPSLLRTTLKQFEESDNFGSLIRPRVTDVTEILKTLELKEISEELYISQTHEKVLAVLRFAHCLAPKYHVVVTNPPYMHTRNMNENLRKWLKDNYPESKNDLFAGFIERSIDLALPKAAIAMITMQSWMFLSSYEAVRSRILQKNTIFSMAHFGAQAFDNISGEVVKTTAFVLGNINCPQYEGTYLELTEGGSEAEKEASMLQAIRNPDCGLFFRAKSADFLGITGKPIAYWISDNLRAVFRGQKTIGYFSDSKQGLATADNARFLRFWHEVEFGRIRAEKNNFDDQQQRYKKWVPYQKGGTFRRWYGNNELVVNWENDGEEIRKFGTEDGGRPRSRVQNSDFFFRPGVTWSDVAVKYAGRYFGPGFLFDTKGPALFPKKETSILELSSYVNSKVFQKILDVSLSGISYSNGVVANMPCAISKPETSHSVNIVERAIDIAKEDWDSQETSWDFEAPPILHPDYSDPSLEVAYEKLRENWKKMTSEMQSLEEENNRIFIDACGLENELTEDVPLAEISLTCNPHYRYGETSEDELESMLLADTIRELISYAVGCMFGRYALEKPGLILAGAGETLEDYRKQIPDPCFPADDDNVIPVLDGEWFTDDIAWRFTRFLRVAFGEGKYEGNLRFVERALGKNGKPLAIRDYFLKHFYGDHIKRYRKRPIYWLFSSPKGSFNALVYIHRYRPDTVSVILNDYLREFHTKLVSHMKQMESASTGSGFSRSEEMRAIKQVEKTRRMISEIEDYEREIFYPLAAKRVEIDLDDGVMTNYAKFGSALRKVPGLGA